MPEVIPGETPTPTVATTTPASVTPANPAVSTDTAATIAQLQSELVNANARIKEVNSESAGHRKNAGSFQAQLQTEQAALAPYRELGDVESIKNQLVQVAQVSTITAERDEALKIVNAVIEEKLPKLSEKARSLIPAADAATPLQRLAKINEIEAIEESLRPARPGIAPAPRTVNSTTVRPPEETPRPRRLGLM